MGASVILKPICHEDYSSQDALHFISYISLTVRGWGKNGGVQNGVFQAASHPPHSQAREHPSCQNTPMEASANAPALIFKMIKPTHKIFYGSALNQFKNISLNFPE